MHIHLDPVGGVAGDMFMAAILDAQPDLESPLLDALKRAGLARFTHVERTAFDDRILHGSQIRVTPLSPEAHHHRHHADIVQLLTDAELDEATRDAALAIFKCLAVAESQVHGVDVDKVAFHEVGAWDSIADIVGAAWLIQHCGATSWSCSALPMGSGRVDGAHGVLPVPAPATALLLRDMPVYTDGLQGERITPTGAAILSYLAPDFSSRQTTSVLNAMGNGFGHKTFDGLSNVLRVMVFDPVSDSADAPISYSAALVGTFEIDDQTSEDLAVALDGLRQQAGVLDVVQMAALGKKNRLVTHIQIVASSQARAAIDTYCFNHTTTLGIRWLEASRSVLLREEVDVDVEGQPVTVKRVRRPSGELTQKADIDQVKEGPTSHAGRQRKRYIAEKSAEKSS